MALWALVATALATDFTCAPPEATAEAWSEHAVCLALSHSAPRAVFDAWGQALALDPELLDAHAGQMNLAAQHDWPEAATLWKRWRDVSITDVGLLWARARLAAQQGAWDRSREDLDAFLAVHPDAKAARLDRAVAARCSGHRDEALEDARATLSDFRSHERLRACWLVADLEVAAGQPEAAREVLSHPDCRADRTRTTGSLGSLQAELDAQLTTTYGTSWGLHCDRSARP